MHNFEKRVLIHDGKEVPSDERYCLALLKDGTMHRAFYNREWVFCDDYLTREDDVKAWCYIEGLFEEPKSADIRMYIDEEDNRI